MVHTRQAFLGEIFVPQDCAYVFFFCFFFCFYIKDLSNYIISLYKAAVWKNRGLAQLRDINEQAVINSLDSTLRFYIKHILKE